MSSQNILLMGMNEQLFQILILITSAVVFPAVPILIISVYMTKRHAALISKIFDHIDEMRNSIFNVESDQKLIFQEFRSAVDRLNEIIHDLKNAMGKD